MDLVVWIPLALVAVLAAAMTCMSVVGRDRVQPERPSDGRAAELLAAGWLPLVECPLDSSACLRCLQVDRCVIHRLLELGLTPGTEVRVVQDAGGPVLLSVRGSRVALGRDLAEKMWVELPDAGAGDPLSISSVPHVN
jgi:Fe2+ transport system protein FeoA